MNISTDPWSLIIIGFGIAFVLSKYGDKNDSDGDGLSGC